MLYLHTAHKQDVLRQPVYGSSNKCEKVFYSAEERPHHKKTVRDSTSFTRLLIHSAVIVTEQLFMFSSVSYRTI
jgi:hypothetical protein